MLVMLLAFVRQDADAQHPTYDPSHGNDWILNSSISDEFDAAQLDTAKWHIQGTDGFYYSNFIGRSPSQFSTDNVRVEDGKLKIQTRWDPDFDFSEQPGQGGLAYENITTAAVVGKSTLTYGYMEIRAKAADASISSSFWMTGNQSELDVFEHLGNPSLPNKAHLETEMWSSIHDWSPAVRGASSWTTRRQLPFRVADDLHVYGVEWDANYLKFHVDGQFIDSVSRAQVEADPNPGGWAIDGPLRIWMDSETFPWHGIPEESDLPVDYEVDYVRVWQRSADPSGEGPVFHDNFGGASLNPVVWNTGRGFAHSSADENLLLSTIGGNWGARGDNSGAGGLHSEVGYASFTIAEDGVNPIGGTFQIGNTVFDNSSNAIARINLATRGAGTYELLWNNSGSTEDFEMPSGWTGTISGNSFVWIVDGDASSAIWGTTNGAAWVDVGDAATAFGFWHANANSTAIIDNFQIWDTLSPALPILQGDFNGDGVVNLADYTVWRDNLGSSFDLNGNGDESDGSAGVVDAADYTLWKDNFGNPAASIGALSTAQVPESSAAVLLILGAITGAVLRRTSGCKLPRTGGSTGSDVLP